jgi:hypothetical protein
MGAYVHSALKPQAMLFYTEQVTSSRFARRPCHGQSLRKHTTKLYTTEQTRVLAAPKILLQKKNGCWRE